MNFKRVSNDQPTISFLTTLIEKNFPFIPIIHQSNSEKPNFTKTNTVQSLHFPLKITEISMLKTGKFEPLFPETPQVQNWGQSFSYRRAVERSEILCLIVFNKTPMPMATLPNGRIGYIGNSITTVKPFRFRLNDINILILSEIHTYYSDITEPIKLFHQNVNQTTKFFVVFNWICVMILYLRKPFVL